MRLFITAGPNTQDMVKGFNSGTGDTVTIVSTAKTLVGSYDSLLEQSITADKLVMFLNDRSNYIAEFTKLEQLLIDKSGTKPKLRKYFKIPEIYVFIIQSKISKLVLEEFSSRFLKYDFITIRGVELLNTDPSLIYERVLGTTAADIAGNKTIERYYVTDDNPSIENYDKELQHKIYENMSYRNIYDYEEAKRIDRISKLGTKLIDDETKNSGVTLDKEVRLDRIGGLDRYTDSNFISIVSGTSNSGSTLLGSMLVTSYIFNGHNVVYVDMSRTKDLKNYLEISSSLGFEYTIAKPKDLLFGRIAKYKDKGLIVIDTENVSLSAIISKLIKVFYYVGNRSIIIDCEIEDLSSIVNLIGSKLRSVNVTLRGDKGDVSYLQRSLDDRVKTNNLTLLYLEDIPDDSFAKLQESYLEVVSKFNGIKMLPMALPSPFIANAEFSSKLLGSIKDLIASSVNI